MKKITLILILIISSLSCKDNLNSNLKTIDIKFSKAKIDLPQNFTKSNSSDLIKEVQNSELPEPIIKNKIQFYKTIESYPLKSLIYSDTNDINNKILFQEGEHVMLNKGISQLYAGKLEEVLEKNWIYQDIAYKRIEIKFSKGGTTQMIKLKYNIFYKDYSNYTTQYIISTLKKTLAITVTSSSDEDYEELIKAMRIK